MFRRIGEYISLDRFYSVPLIIFLSVSLLLRRSAAVTCACHRAAVPWGGDALPLRPEREDFGTPRLRRLSRPAPQGGGGRRRRHGQQTQPGGLPALDAARIQARQTPGAGQGRPHQHPEGQAGDSVRAGAGPQRLNSFTLTDAAWVSIPCDWGSGQGSAALRRLRLPCPLQMTGFSRKVKERVFPICMQLHCLPVLTSIVHLAYLVAFACSLRGSGAKWPFDFTCSRWNSL